MSTYTWINLIVISLPLALSFDRKVAFFRTWASVVGAVIVVGIVWVGWDVYATANGEWSFNPDYVGRLHLFGLPLGEVLFFVTVPYACLFIFAVARAYFKDRRVPFSPWPYLGIAALLIVLAFVFGDQPYTFKVLLSTAAFLATAAVLFPGLFSSSHFWLAMGITYVPFLIVNGVLTALPIVLYADAAIWGVRVFTIPLEDFFYSFSMLGFDIMVYRALDFRLRKTIEA